MPRMYPTLPTPRPLPAAGHGPELMPALAQERADLVVLLGRERAAADAGRVGLGDPEDVADGSGRNPRARGRLSGDRVRRCHERIGAVIDVEHGALRALEEDALARLARVVQPVPDGHGVGQQPLGNLVDPA